MWRSFSVFVPRLGVATYHESKLILGPTEDHLDDIDYRPDCFDDGWEADIVDSSSGFVETNAADIEFDGDLLLGQQIFLIEGVLLFGFEIRFDILKHFINWRANK